MYGVFCCQQAVEKALKALIVERTGEMPPRLHNLPRLAEEAGIDIDECGLTFLSRLTGFYIQTRYPDDLQRLSSSATEASATSVLKETGKTTQWLLSMLTWCAGRNPSCKCSRAWAPCAPRSCSDRTSAGILISGATSMSPSSWMRRQPGIWSAEPR
ncbi:MAG: HEPN domain-containing protein [Phycisphaerales bacterium]|nr:HEPN domain-containing protein [Phycisphaerales bacterium]